jgi:hypothetical protein
MNFILKVKIFGLLYGAESKLSQLSYPIPPISITLKYYLITLPIHTSANTAQVGGRTDLAGYNF